MYATNTDASYLSNNALQSLFSEYTVSANGVKISKTNETYALKTVIETEFWSGKVAKNTRLICQRYYFEDEPAEIERTDGRADDVVARKALVAKSQENYFIGKPASGISTCDKHLLSGVNLRVSIRKSTNDFVVTSESNKLYKVKKVEASPCVRKMTIVDHVLTAIEKNSTKNTCRVSLNRVITTYFFKLQLE